ncbi:MAG: hypothetical protein ACRC80_33695, partial [Waterburya sp.]
GYLYPSQKRAHHNLSYTLRKTLQADYQSGTWEEVIEEIESKNLPKIILSSESFVEPTKIDFVWQVAEKLEKYSTKIIIYLRRQDRKIESHLVQRIKTGATFNDFDKYISEELAIDYLGIINNWSEVFGKENIIVKPFEQEQMKRGDLHQDFLSILNIDTLDNFERPNDVNIRPNLAQIIGTNFINKKIAEEITQNNRKDYQAYRLDIKENAKYPKSFFKYTQHWQSKSNYNLLPYKKAVEILRDSEEQNSQIAKQFLDREDGCLFYEDLKPYEHDLLDLDTLDKQQLIDLCSYIFMLTAKR